MKKQVRFMFKNAAKFLFTLLLIPSLVFAEPSADEISDPLETINRGTFWFNDQFDTYLFKPLAEGYHWVMPDVAESSVNNVFDTLSYPSYLVSSLMQGKVSQSLDHTGRFLINATLGVAGIFDVATELGFKKHKEDFGSALAYNGVAAGPYIVLPFLGPSNLRDGLGRIVDTVLNPSYWVRYSDASSDTKFWVPWSARGLEALNVRAELLEAIETGKEASSDYYLFSQSSYYQHRNNLIFDGQAPEEEDFFGEPGSEAAAHGIDNK